MSHLLSDMVVEIGCKEEDNSKAALGSVVITADSTEMQSKHSASQLLKPVTSV